MISDKRNQSQVISSYCGGHFPEDVIDATGGKVSVICPEGWDYSQDNWSQGVVYAKNYDVKHVSDIWQFFLYLQKLYKNDFAFLSGSEANAWHNTSEDDFKNFMKLI